MNAQLASLQEQVDSLYANLNAMRSTADANSYAPLSDRSMSMSQHSGVQTMSPMGRYKPTPRHPSFRGPTSSAFGLDVAKTTLHNMGYPGLADEGSLTQDPTPVPSPPPARPRLPMLNANGSRAPDPLRSVTREEMVRLCRVYEEEMGLMYPVVNIEELIQHGTNLHDFIDAAVRNGLATTDHRGINDYQSCALKTIMAISMIVEGSGQSDMAYRLFESVREPADRALHSEVVEFKSLPFLVLLVSGFFLFPCLFCWFGNAVGCGVACCVSQVREVMKPSSLSDSYNGMNMSITVRVDLVWTGNLELFFTLVAQRRPMSIWDWNRVDSE
jgi:hypothetical protein